MKIFQGISCIMPTPQDFFLQRRPISYEKSSLFDALWQYKNISRLSRERERHDDIATTGQVICKLCAL